jgi:hypothetical protein
MRMYYVDRARSRALSRHRYRRRIVMRELTPDVIAKLSPDQIELLIELGDLARKEAELNEQIDSIRRQTEKVGLAPNNRATRAIHEDPAFVDLLSVRAIGERSIIRGKIGGILRSLASSGLSDLGIVARQAVNYGIKLQE